MVNGQRISITMPTKKEAEREAAALKSGVKSAQHNIALTVTEAFDRYIDSKSAVLSPATVAGYRRIQKNLLEPIANMPLATLTQEQVQRWVNALVKQGKKPKTVSNAHGLLSAVLASYRPDMTLRTTANIFPSNGLSSRAKLALPKKGRKLLAEPAPCICPHISPR